MKKKINDDPSLDVNNIKGVPLYEALEGEIEEELGRMWSGILNIGLVGRNDNFFELGGNSLQAARIIDKIYEDFGIELPVRTIFELQTIKDLVQKIGDTYDEAFSEDMDEGVM